MQSVNLAPTTLENIFDSLRRHGIEGDAAFYLVVSRYLDRWLSGTSKLRALGPGIVENGNRVCRMLPSDSEVFLKIDSQVEADPRGKNLPVFYQFFLGRKFREGSGKFFTPRAVAASMVELLPVRDGSVVMDPTCGGGTFLAEAALRWGEVACRLVGNEIDASLADLTRVVLALTAGQNQKWHVINNDLFEPSDEVTDWKGRVDYILANPPFSLPISKTKWVSPIFSAGYKNSDAIFLDVCQHLLKKGGRLACVLPHSIVANGEYSDLRSLVEKDWELIGIVGLPEGVFNLTASTTARVDVVLLEKKGGATSTKRFFGHATSVGVKLNRRMQDSSDNQLQHIVENEEVQNIITAVC